MRPTNLLIPFALWAFSSQFRAAEPVTIEFTSTNLVAHEEQVALKITVKRAEGSAANSVNLRTRGGTAVPGKDYVERAMTIEFAPAETSKTVLIPILDNGLVEPEKTFELLLTNPLDSQPVGGANRATVTIVDNEQPVVLDASFDPGTGPDSDIVDMVLSKDGRLIIAGCFTSINGVSRIGVARLNSDGSVDMDFQPPGDLTPCISKVVIQSDGRLLVGGWANTYAGNEFPTIARLNSNGTRDTSFQIRGITGEGEQIVDLAYWALQPGDQVVMVAGISTSTGFIDHRLVRLLADGRLDSSFNADPALADLINGQIRSFIALPDGRIVLAVLSSTSENGSTTRIIRLHSDGSRDPSFVFEPKWQVSTLNGYADGRLIVTGLKGGLVDPSVPIFARLNSDGSVDSGFSATFDSRLFGIGISSVGITSEDKILLAGYFWQVNGIPRDSVARLNPDGTVDGQFRGPATTDSGYGEQPATLVLSQPDGDVIVAGEFQFVDGHRQSRLARLKGSLGVEGGPEFTVSVTEVGEEAGEAALEVRRTGETTKEMSVNYRTIDGTATSGADYAAQSGVLTFKTLENKKTIHIPIINDLQVEDMEFFQIVLDPVPGAVSNQTNAVVRIRDNDFGIGFTLNRFETYESQSPAEISLARQGDDLRALDVDWAVTGGFAVLGRDFTQLKGTARFAAGEGTTTFQFPLLEDGLADGDQIVQLSLSDPQNRQILSRSPYATNATLVIHDDQLPGVRLDLGYFADIPINTAAPLPSFPQVFFSKDGSGLVGTSATDASHPAGYSRIFLINPDGKLNPQFAVAPEVGLDSGTVTPVAWQSDGKILVTSSNRILRLQPSGALDLTFNVTLSGAASWQSPQVYRVILESAGKILIVGSFSAVNDVPRVNVARVAADGSVDSFVATIPSDASVADIIFDQNGKFLIGWNQQTGSGSGGPAPQRFTVRILNGDGSTGATIASGEFTLNSMKLQPDGKLLVLGNEASKYSYTSLLHRFNVDGSEDGGFQLDSNFGGQWSYISAWEMQPDGRVFVAWNCGNCSPQNYRLYRLSADGTVDRTFDPGFGADAPISTIHLLTDGNALIGGSFLHYDTIARPFLARVDLNAPPAPSVQVNPLILRMEEGSASPPVILRRLGDTASPLVLDYTTVDGTARAGIDYIPLHGTLSFAAFQSTATIILPALDNSWPDADLTYSLRFNSSSPGLKLGSPANEVIVQLLDRQRSGAVDTSFVPALSLSSSGYSTPPLTIVLPDDRLLIVDDLPDFPGEEVSRLLPNGALDATFHKPSDIQPSWARLYAMALLLDGKILIGGFFTSIQGVARSNIARLNGDGTIDPGFDAGNMAATPVTAIAVQADGKLLAAAATFNTPRGTRQGVVRLSANGAFDPSLQTDTPGTIDHLISLEDGTILIGGSFNTINGITRVNLARLNRDGSVDETFHPSVTNNWPVSSILPQPGGKLLVCCGFAEATGAAAVALVRLNRDGQIDPTFEADTNAPVQNVALAMQPDGKILVAGSLATSGTAGVVRLWPDGSLDFSFDAPSVTTPLPLLSLTQQKNGDVLLNLTRLVGPAPEPGFSNVKLAPGGRAKVTLNGIPTRKYRIESSADLQRWTSATEVHFDLPSVYRMEVELDSPGDHSFYRAVEIAP